MGEWVFARCRETSKLCNRIPRLNELGARNHVESLRTVVMALLLCGSALLNNGCADDAFLPPPEMPPPGQSAPSEDTPQPLQPPTDL
jgi:hypothetical protein